MSQTQTEVVIVSAARTPIGKQGGYFNTVSAEDLGVLAVREAIERSGINLTKIKIDQLIAGMMYVDSRCQQIYLPRNVGVRVGKLLNDKDNIAVAPGKTTLRICGTGFQTIADAFDLLTAEPNHKMNCIVSFAAENMSQTNLVQQGRRKKASVWEFEDAPLKDFLLEGFNHYYYQTMMPKTAEKYGAQVGITRKDCDEFAYLSHTRAAKTQLKQWNRFAKPNKKGYLRGSFVVDAVDEQGTNISVWRDEGTRADISIAELKGLRPLLGPGGMVTPGTASQISDGAASMMLMDRKFADKNNIPYLAIIRGYHFATVDPSIMGQGPVPAIKGLLQKLKLKQSGIELFEVNEAFAAQYLAVEKELGLPRDLTNVNGGAIALGHNIAATGLRIMVDLVYELKRRGLKTGIGSACIGGGQGGAVCVETVS